MEKIYVKVKLESKSKRELIADFLLKQPATYTNKDKTIVECSAFRARSLEAIHSICKTVFKTTTEKEVAIILNDLAKDCKIGIVACPTIKKLTFFSLKNKQWWSFYDKTTGELWEHGKDKIYNFKKTNNSFDDFIKIINK